MNNENGASASSVIDLASHAPPSSRLHHRLDENARLNASRFGVGARRRKTSDGFAAPSARRARAGDALPLNDFLSDLRLEMRRVERSRAALSLVIYQLSDKTGQASRQADELLEALHEEKRETDILGHLGDDAIAVLCPDTDESGTRGFMRKIDERTGALRIAAVAATYPDDLFESLVNGTDTRPAFQPFLVSDSSDHTGHSYALKRGLDIAGALIALVLLAPLMLVVAAAIALGSRGPVIFKQTRLGKGGVPFTFYKFRSMVTNVDDRIHREFVAGLIKAGQTEGTAPNSEAAPYKLHGDPRVTRIGRFIRKTSIDELPQFFNVLKGDMSLVGPRPPIPYETVHYQSWHLRRILSMKPGITGLWQVDGRSKVTFNEMVRMDLRYIRECSLALDLKILLKTALVVLRCEGAV